MSTSDKNANIAARTLRLPLITRIQLLPDFATTKPLAVAPGSSSPKGLRLVLRYSDQLKMIQMDLQELKSLPCWPMR